MRILENADHSCIQAFMPFPLLEMNPGKGAVQVYNLQQPPSPVSLCLPQTRVILVWGKHGLVQSPHTWSNWSSSNQIETPTRQKLLQEVGLFFSQCSHFCSGSKNWNVCTLVVSIRKVAILSVETEGSYR